MKFQQQRGVVLVITLIMLSIITVMAVAFLALSRRERASVVHSQNSIDAELMAATALERAKGEVLANIIGRSNLLGPELLVSGARTFVPPDPFLYGDAAINGLLADKAAIWSLTNGSHPPVFVRTKSSAPSREQRFYLDLNRNGRFETNGLVYLFDNNGAQIPDANSQPAFGLMTGDPEWLGILSRPGFLHTNNNRFIGRYCYIVLPVGHSLDLNFIHNQAKGLPMSQNGFRRNQGVGTWEINLAGLLADLNTNIWGAYSYNPAMGLPSGNLAFDDATALLTHRYQGDYRSLLRIPQLFPNAAPLGSDLIDFFAAAPIVPLGGRPSADYDDLNGYWPGSDSTNHFYSVHDFLGKRIGLPADLTGFSNRLWISSTNTSSYDSYTFYRMLSQLGTDTGPESTNRLNINYKNINGTNVTDFVTWSPIEFFTNAAWRMLREEFKTNRQPNDVFASIHQLKIPVYNPANTNLNGKVIPLYSSRIHRLLQLAANIYEATSGSKFGEEYPYYPAVFRPLFEQTNGTLYITGYEEAPANYVASVFSDLDAGRRIHEMADPSIERDSLVLGVPLIIGARKGIPNFNEFAVQTFADFTRKVELRKDVAGPSGRIVATNQMFIVGLSNVFAMEAWNAYTNFYPPSPRSLTMRFTNIMTVSLTNSAGLTNTSVLYGGTNAVGIGFGPLQFRTGGITVGTVLSNAVYRSTPPHFEPVSLATFDRTEAGYTNRWGLTVSNRMIYFLVDGGHIVDAFTASDLNGDFDLSAELNNRQGDQYQLWDNTPAGGVTLGVRKQIDISTDQPALTSWNDYSVQVGDRRKAVDGFRVFLGKPPLYFPPTGIPNTNLSIQAPFTPTRKIMKASRWEANDPIVHYLPDDLRIYKDGNLTNEVSIKTVMPPSTPISITDGSSIGSRNSRYRPWGGNDQQQPDTDPTAFDLRVKDPGIMGPDNWDFPTNKFPDVGWIGRVHRGTPWQTVYLKAYPTTDPTDWMMPAGGPGLSMETHPTNDWKFLDMFTAALHPNATRGQLSVNQTNLAAWSAVLSGVTVTTAVEPTPDTFVAIDTNIVPAAIQGQLQYIFDGITRVRSQMPTTLTTPTNRFTRIGEILSVPELSVASPFLIDSAFSQRWTANNRNQIFKDIDYERIPDQIMSLLRVGEARFVIYAFGQSLKPEYVDPATGVALNYQITGEVATRTVVRVEFDGVRGSKKARYGGPDVQIVEIDDPGGPDVNRPHVVVEQFNVLPPE